MKNKVLTCNFCRKQMSGKNKFCSSDCLNKHLLNYIDKPYSPKKRWYGPVPIEKWEPQGRPHMYEEDINLMTDRLKNDGIEFKWRA